MIKNIIFDIGNVLVTFDPIAYFKDFYDETTNAFLCKEVFSSNTWLEVDQGLVSELEARAYFLKKLPTYTNEIHTLFDHWKGLMVEKRDTVQFLDEVKQQGFKVYLLSNIGEDSYRYCVENFSFFDNIDGGVYSYQEKLIKPEERLYECLLNKYQLLPGECIFIDDSTKNVLQARIMGIHAIVFNDFKQVKDDVYHILKEEAHVKG